MTDTIVRKDILNLVTQANTNGAPMYKIAPIIGYSTRTLKRWRIRERDKRTEHTNFTPANKLSLEERKYLISVANNEEYKNLSAHQIVPKLADKGIYLASESTFYRVLKEHNQLTHRHKQQVATKSKPTPLVDLVLVMITLTQSLSLKHSNIHHHTPVNHLRVCLMQEYGVIHL